MAVDFPDNPAVGDTFTVAPKEFTWNNWAWQRGPIAPAPILTAISPTSASSAEPTHALTLTGSNFDAATLAVIDDVNVPTTYVSIAQLTCQATVTTGAHNVTAERYGVGGGSAQTFTVGDPVLTAIAPTTAKSTDTTLALTLTGNYFHASSVVYVNGVAQPTTFTSMTQLSATLNPSALGHGTWPVEVRTGTLTTAAINLVVSMVPQVTGVSPLAGRQNEALTLTVTGKEFASGNQITVGGVAIPTTFVSATQLTASYTSAYFHPDNLGQLDLLVNVAGSPSPNHTLNLIDPRCKIKSCFPDYFSDWLPDWDVEVWCDGIIDTVSVVHIDGVAQDTELKGNVVGTEFMLLTHFDLTPYPDDTYIYLTVLNDGKHWSAGAPWGYWVERIGLDKEGPTGPPQR